jgi:chromate transporter
MCKTQGGIILKENLKTYWKLFLSMLTLSAFTFGGGFVIISLMKKKFVEEYHWLEEEEMLDLAAIAQSAPGALAVNASIIVGYRIKRFKGALVSVIGIAIPPLVIISLISVFYEQFKNNQVIAIALMVMRAGVAAVIFDVVINLAGNLFKTKNIMNIILLFAAFIANAFLGISAITIIIICIIIALITVLYKTKKGVPLN